MAFEDTYCFKITPTPSFQIFVTAQFFWQNIRHNVFFALPLHFFLFAFVSVCVFFFNYYFFNLQITWFFFTPCFSFCPEIFFFFFFAKVGHFQNFRLFVYIIVDLKSFFWREIILRQLIYAASLVFW